MCVYVQGCPHKCAGCHNPQTHPFDLGYIVDICDVFKQFTQNPLLAGMTFSGGEPFCRAQPLSELGRMVKDMGKNLWVYSGYTHEELLEMAKTDVYVMRLLQITDVLVDGRYDETQRTLDIPFVGSANQRVIQLR